MLFNGNYYTTGETRWEPSQTDGFRRTSSKVGEFVGLRPLPAVGVENHSSPGACPEIANHEKK